MKLELNNVATVADGEVKLFREMSDILSLNYHVTFIEETHQHYVEFHSPTVTALATREIADLWIITFSPTKRRGRMTFLQAKYHRGVLDQNNRSFKGDYFQFELLSSRPDIRNIGRRINLPSTILKDACLPSIGSYGVFYIDPANKIDLAYCSAQYLKPAAKPTHYAGFQTDLEIPFNNVHTLGKCSANICDELISCFDIDEFTKSLLDLEIGAELFRLPKLLQFMAQILRPYATSTAVRELLDFIDLPPGVPNDNDVVKGSEGLPCSLLVVNVDPTEK